MKTFYTGRARGTRKMYLMGVITVLVISCIAPLSSARHPHPTGAPEDGATSAEPPAFGAGATRAYDENDCDRMFGSANVEKVKTFKMEASHADFGDEPHLGGGPLGNAVICWSIDGRVAVKGKLYSDNFHDPQTATVDIRFRRTNGRFTNLTWRSITTNGGWVSHREVEKVSPVGNFNQVRIRLKLYTHTDLGETRRVVLTKTFTR